MNPCFNRPCRFKTSDKKVESYYKGTTTHPMKMEVKIGHLLSAYFVFDSINRIFTIVTKAALATSTVQVADYIFLIGFITRVQNCLRINSKWSGGQSRGVQSFHFFLIFVDFSAIFGDHLLTFKNTILAKNT